MTAPLLSLDASLALIVFAAASSATPGPNNLMLMASGARFGLAATLPHLLGVSLGFAFLAIGVGLGLGALLEAEPALEIALKIICSAVLLRIVYSLATAPTDRAISAADGARPMTFWEAAGFQWLNPKAWVMALTAIAIARPAPSATPLEEAATIVVAALLFAAINFPSCGVWAVAGRQITELLHTQTRRRLFNIVMASLLGLMLVPILA